MFNKRALQNYRGLFLAILLCHNLWQPISTAYVIEAGTKQSIVFQKGKRNVECNDSEAFDAQSDFRRCSDRPIKSVYDELTIIFDNKEKESNSMVEMNGNEYWTRVIKPEEMKKLICDSLKDLNQNCTGILNKCFSANEVKEKFDATLSSFARHFEQMFENLDLFGCPELPNDFVSKPCKNLEDKCKEIGQAWDDFEDCKHYDEFLQCATENHYYIDYE